MMDRHFDFPPVQKRSARQGQSQFDEFEATELYCAQCRKAVPVKKSLLLVLPEGDKYDYRCAYCGNTVGDKIDRAAEPFGILHR